MNDSLLLDDAVRTDLGGVVPLMERVEQRLLENGGDPDAVFQVKLAFEEALTNAMRHGNKLDAARVVQVRVWTEAEFVGVDVHDQGEGFDPAQLPDPTSADRVSKPCGRGVYLMQKMMDEVEFYDGGRGVKMRKKIAGLA